MIKKFKLIILYFPILFVGLYSCKEDTINRIVPKGEQITIGRLSGTWANPTKIITPEGVPSEVFGEMRLTFTTDNYGNPDKFLAKKSPIIFSEKPGLWEITGDDFNKVFLSNVEPIDEFEIEITSTTLKIKFYVGWENTETGETGEGNFGVTLTRK